jgi:hypothetical protein
MWGLVGIIYGYYFGTKKDLSHRRELAVQKELIDTLTRRLEIAVAAAAEAAGEVDCT